jgi:hypothetical protein
MPDNPPQNALRDHVSGAIARGEATPISEHPARITAEIGTSGQFEIVKLSADARADIAEAIDLEHHCGDIHSCDIARANEDGFPLWSADLLRGATETPLLDAVIAYHVSRGLDFTSGAEAEREAWLASATWQDHAHECGSCGAYTFGDDYWTPTECGSCGAALDLTDEWRNSPPIA